MCAAKTLDGRLLCASECAYEIENPYFQGVGYAKGSTVKRITKGINSCLVGRTMDGIVVAFRGTQPGSLLDWLQNAAIYLRRVDGIPGRIHSGFYDATKALYDHVKEAILELLQEISWYGRRKIFITGHSKGGCLASLTAFLMAHDKEVPNAVYVCSFGGARVGDPDFQAAYNRTVLQTTYENSLDIVPFLPPGPVTVDAMDKRTQKKINRILWSHREAHRAKDYFWNYRPVGKRLYIDENGRIIKNVTKELDYQRIHDIESKTLLSSADFLRAHCPTCPDQKPKHGKSRCSGGYFCAVAPEVCRSEKGACCASCQEAQEEKK